MNANLARAPLRRFCALVQAMAVQFPKNRGWINFRTRMVDDPKTYAGPSNMGQPRLRSPSVAQAS